MDAGTVAISISGIVASGIIGPLIVTAANRAGDKAKANRDLRRSQRDELRDVLDESARLLSSGPRILRRASNATPPNPQLTADATDWADRIYPMRERLALRLPPNHPILDAFDKVRTATTALAKAPTDQTAIDQYDRQRAEYLAAARTALTADLDTRQT